MAGLPMCVFLDCLIGPVWHNIYRLVCIDIVTQTDTARQLMLKRVEKIIPNYLLNKLSPRFNGEQRLYHGQYVRLAIQ